MHCKNPFMQEAIKEALIARDKGEVPVGCVIVRNNEIISRGHNQRETSKQSIYHAEILAIHKACEKINDWRLSDCDLYVTLEPCIMCAGAILNSRIRRLYFGAYDRNSGALGSQFDIFRNNNLNHYVEVYEGIEEEACTNIIKSFFEDIRFNKKE